MASRALAAELCADFVAFSARAVTESTRAWVSLTI
jgi:hypothetical protein